MATSVIETKIFEDEVDGSTVSLKQFTDVVNRNKDFDPR